MSEDLLLASIRVHHPISAAELYVKTGVHSGELYHTLWRLVADGAINAAFEDGPYPRRRLYWPASADTTSK
jgi:hypothetical protein